MAKKPKTPSEKQIAKQVNKDRYAKKKARDDEQKKEWKQRDTSAEGKDVG